MEVNSELSIKWMYTVMGYSLSFSPAYDNTHTHTLRELGPETIVSSCISDQINVKRRVALYSIMNATEFKCLSISQDVAFFHNGLIIISPALNHIRSQTFSITQLDYNSLFHFKINLSYMFFKNQPLV